MLLKLLAMLVFAILAFGFEALVAFLEEDRRDRKQKTGVTRV